MIAMKLIDRNNYRISLQQAIKIPKAPSRYYFQRWIATALEGRRKKAEVAIRIVGEKESAALNYKYRHKKGSTNILSFPFEPPANIQLPLLGDLIICAPVVSKEARQQNKSLSAHWAHMVIHGTLHLLGYDHIKKYDALVMEQIEIELLNKLGYPNPYYIQEK